MGKDKVYDKKVEEKIKTDLNLYGPVYLMPPREIYDWNIYQPTKNKWSDEKE